VAETVTSSAASCVKRPGVVSLSYGIPLNA
jgi:hypothetical protein